jgi:hypothetical protein
MLEKISGFWRNAKRALGIGVNSTPVGGRRRPRVIDMIARHEARPGLDRRGVSLGDMARADEARSASAGLQDTGPARWPGRSATAVDRVTVVPVGVVHPGTTGRPVAESRSGAGLPFDGSRR